jgi:hypothetical protein
VSLYRMALQSPDHLVNRLDPDTPDEPTPTLTLPPPGSWLWRLPIEGGPFECPEDRVNTCGCSSPLIWNSFGNGKKGNWVHLRNGSPCRPPEEG